MQFLGAVPPGDLTRLYAATTVQQPAQSTPPSPQAPPAINPAPGTVPQDTRTTVLQGPAPGVSYHQPVVLSTSIENARNRMRDNRRFVNMWAVELHKKFAISVACTVFILVGAPIATSAVG